MKPHIGLVRIVAALSIPAMFMGCIQKSSNGTFEKHVKELDAAGEMYGSLGLNRHKAWPLFTSERDSTGKPIPIDINFVGQCLELYKKYQIAPSPNDIVLFQEQEWDWGRIEKAIEEDAKYLPRVQY